MNSNWTLGDTVQLLKHADYRGITDFQQFKEKTSGLMKSTLSSRYAFMFTSSSPMLVPDAGSITAREFALHADSCRKVLTMSTSRYTFNSMSRIHDHGEEEKRPVRAKKRSTLPPVTLNDPNEVPCLTRALHRNEPLKELRIAYMYNPEPIQMLAEGLHLNTQLSSVTFYGTAMGAPGMAALTRALLDNHTISFLRIAQDLSIPTKYWEEFLRAAFSKSQLRTLQLFENRSPPTFIMSILSITSSTFSDDAVDVIARSLETNSTVTSLELGIVSERGVQHLNDALDNNRGLTDFRLYVQDVGRYLGPTVRKCLIRNRQEWVERTFKFFIFHGIVPTEVARLFVQFSY